MDFRRMTLGWEVCVARSPGNSRLGALWLWPAGSAHPVAWRVGEAVLTERTES
jgi:hypothetical protein